MNECLFIGRLANEVDLRQTTSGKSVCQFRLAVQRRVPNAQGVREADFITIVMWGKTAENAAKYLKKGTKIALGSEVHVRTYQAQDGSNRTVTEFVADWWEFAGAKQDSDGSGHQRQQQPEQQPATNQNDFTEVDDDELPF